MASRLNHRNLASKRPNSSPRSAFTLLEILVVIGIIALLAAMLFPAFNRARESSRQASCQSNLHEIYMAVQQYYQDERRYPDSLVDLLPEGGHFENSTAADTVIDSSQGFARAGYLKGSNNALLCPDDDLSTGLPRSSYGALRKDLVAPTAQLVPGASNTPPADPTADTGRYAYNYWGYDVDGFAYANSALAQAAITSADANRLVDSGSSFDPRKNPIANSLSFRFASPATIITHCMFHRLQTANNLVAPGELSNTADADDSANAMDMILRLDGSVKATNVSMFKAQDAWRNQG